MTKRLLRKGVGCFLLAVASVPPGTAFADWPTTQHDTRRTSVSVVGSNLTTPAVYWRSRLGGAPSQVYLGDTNRDGSQDVLYIGGGGRLVLASPDGTVLWQTGQNGYQAILAVADVNQDGQPDVVVGSAAQVSILAGKSGQIEWAESPTELGTLGDVRLADLTGDGRLDLWEDTCGCCGLETGSPGVIYSFAGGFAAPTTLGPPPARAHCGSSSNTIVDLVGDGHLEMVSMGDTEATAFRSDGSILASSGTLPARSFRAQCQPANIDGNPGDELVCFTDAVYGGGGERGLFALAYHAAPSPTLDLLWNVQVSDAASGDAEAPTSVVVDLDGDGKPEAIVSGEQTGAYTTSVLDAATGTVLTTTPGVVLGDVPAVTAGQRWILVSNPNGVSAMAFTRTPAALTQVWSLPSQILTWRDWTRALVSGFSTQLVSPDLNGDGRPDLVVSSTTEPYVLSGYDTSTGMPGPLGQYALDTGVSALSVGASNFKGGASLFVGRNDGYIALLSGTLAPTNQVLQGSSTLPGMYVGGYYTGRDAYYGFSQLPVAAKLSPTDPGQALLVVDSRGDLLRIDPSAASISAPAKPTWRLTDSHGAGIRPSATGSAAIGVFRRRHPITDPPVYVVSSIGTDGTELASLTLPRSPVWDVLPGDFLGDGSTSFACLDTDSAATSELTVMSATGQQVWQNPIQGIAGTAPLSTADWNGDGATDVAMVIDVARVYSGKDGSALATGSDMLAYYSPILAPLQGGTQLDMVLQGGALSARALGHDLTSLWTSAGPAQAYPLGALATCPSGPVLVQATWSVNATLTLTQAAGASPGATSSVILASGSAYPDMATATAASATLGNLSDVAVSANLDGSGKGPTALLGSTDGYLYAVDACTGSLRWSFPFGYPVSSPILADTDGDGRDEIVVSVGDGYLYDLKNEALPPPSFVWDTDPPAGVTDMDVSSIDTVSTLYAKWGAVTGAASYEVTVVDSAGDYVMSPHWVDVGAVTAAAIPNLPLIDCAKYVIGVRAVAPLGRSPDTPSNGVVVHLPGMHDGGACDGTGGAGGAGGSGGARTASTGGASPGDFVITGRAGCSVPSGSGGWSGLTGIVVAIAALTRRRSRRANGPSSGTPRQGDDPADRGTT
jgi:hypothetical protein